MPASASNEYDFLSCFCLGCGHKREQPAAQMRHELHAIMVYDCIRSMRHTSSDHMASAARQQPFPAPWRISDARHCRTTTHATMDETAAAAEIVETLPGRVDGAGPGNCGPLHRAGPQDHLHRRAQILPSARNRGLQRGSLQMGEEEDGAHRRRAQASARPSSTISARFTANGRTARRSKATATSTALSCAGARSCRWTSGTTAPNGCSPATASRRDALSAAAARGDWAGRRSRARRRPGCL